MPDDDLLEQYGSKLMEIDDTVVGLVGLVRFPRSPNIPLHHAAVLMSYLTYMFEIAERSDMHSPAWGVTSNIPDLCQNRRWGGCRLHIASH